MLYFHPTLFLKNERYRQMLHNIPGVPLRAKLKILGASANNERFDHNDFNLETEPFECLRPSFGTKNRIVEIESYEQALSMICRPFLATGLSFIPLRLTVIRCCTQMNLKALKMNISITMAANEENNIIFRKHYKNCRDFQSSVTRLETKQRDQNKFLRQTTWHSLQ